MTNASRSAHSSSPRRVRRALIGGALTIGLAAAIPATAGAAPATWDEFAPLGKPQPIKVHPAVGQQKMIMIAIPGGGWSAGTNTLLDLYGYMDWWTKLVTEKGIAVHVITHRQGGYSGAVPEEIGDLGLAMGKIRNENPGVPICIYGLSSGGHLAAMMQILRPDITKCVVSDGGPLDMEAFFQDSGELRGITLGDFFQGQTAQTQVRDWFNTPEHGDNVDRLSPSTQTGRIGDLFAIEAGRNPDGSAADRSVGDRQGQLIADKIPARTTVRYVHAATDDQKSVPTAHNIYSSFLDSSPGGAEETEARQIYGEAADWMLKQAAKATAALTPAPAAPVTPPPGAAALPAAIANTPVKVTLRGAARVRPDSRGRVTLRVRCAGGSTTCKGTAQVLMGALKSRTASYKVTTARSTYATVRVALSAAQLKALSKRSSVVTKVRLTGTSAQRKSVTVSKNVRVLRTAALARKNAAAKK